MRFFKQKEIFFKSLLEKVWFRFEEKPQRKSVLYTDTEVGDLLSDYFLEPPYIPERVKVRKAPPRSSSLQPIGFPPHEEPRYPQWIPLDRQIRLSSGHKRCGMPSR